MHRSSHTLISFAVLLALIVTFVPMPAHAIGAGDVLSFTASTFLTIIYDLLDLVHRLIMLLIAGIGSILQAVINLAPGSGGAPVYTMWRILRDFCNMAFIVVLILMSFATIFGVFNIPFLSAFNIHKGVISGFLLAALLLNFSMAIGQTVILGSNQAVKMVLTVLPKNLGAAIAQSVNFAATNINSFAVTKPPVIIDNVDVAGLTPGQNKALALYGDVTIRQQVDECIKNNVDKPNNCYNRIVLPRIQSLQANAQALQESGSNPLTFLPSTALRCLGAAVGFGSQCTVPTTPQADSFTLFKMIAEKIMVIFLSLILAISFVAVFVFMVVRIPYLWVLLAVSPLAYVSLAFPGSKGFGMWWKQFLGWNIFAPLYLFVIYLGMILINATSTAVASLAPINGTVPLITGTLGSLFSYGIVGLVLVYGGGMVLKYSIASGSAAGTWVGGITGTLGFTKEGGAAAAIYRRTGLSAQVQGITERIQQQGRDVTAGLRGRAPALFGTQAEGLAAARQRFGVRGGAAEIEKLQKQRIDEQQNILKARNLDNQGLERVMKSGNRDAALAAGEILLSKGGLNAEQIKRMSEQYRTISPVAQKSFQEKVAKNLDEKVKEKKFEGPKEVLASLELLSGGQREKFLKNLERNQPLIAAELADKFYPNPDGSKGRASDVLERNVGAIDNETWIQVLSQAKDNPDILTPRLRQALRQKAGNLNSYMEMARRATPEQQAKLLEITRAPYADVDKAQVAARKEDRERSL